MRTWCKGVETSPGLLMEREPERHFPTYMAFVSLLYSIHRPGIELGLSRILRLHSLHNESDTMTLR